MEFIKYQHLERFGTTEVEGIEFGEVYVFPKIDGTNASLWLDKQGGLQAGSRRRHLTLENDNAKFLKTIQCNKPIHDYLSENPTHRLYGEWLVPHSLKTYKDNAWRKFYVFDVSIDKQELTHEGDSKVNYIPFDEYEPLLKKHGLEYIVPLAIMKNPSYEQIIKQLDKNDFLIQDGKGFGEGIVIKNYGWKNKYGRQTWAKIVTSEFKEAHKKEMGATYVEGKKMVEEEISDKYVTKALCEKVYSKIENDTGWTSRMIPRLLNTVYYDVVKEDCWNFVKEHKNPKINFKTLQHFVFLKTKQQLPNLF